MPRMIPVQTVHVARPNKSGRKHKDSDDLIHDTIRPKLGEPFDFTDDELRDIQNASPGALREPINEGGEQQEQQEEEADKAARQAVEAARANRSAAGDAARVARTGAVGRGARKQPDNTDRGEAPGPDAEDEDEL